MPLKVKPLTRLQRSKLHAIKALADAKRNFQNSIYVHSRGSVIELSTRSLLELLESAYSAGSQFEIDRMREELNKP